LPSRLSPILKLQFAEVLTVVIDAVVAALEIDYGLPVNCSPQTGDIYPLIRLIRGLIVRRRPVWA
ncbi:hypothetical protein, partial [Mycobacterium avium]|uniref:hypothetical protein n=2 Tax=Mycobacterium avium TaxID=1764 RepID=UPI001F2A8440